MKGFLKNQITEIASDPVLRIYGMLLALSHILSATWWFRSDSISWMARGNESICWPGLGSCEYWRFSYNGLIYSILIYCLASLVVMFLFLQAKRVPLAYAGLIGLNLAKLFLLSLDYRLRMNQHYMAGFITLAFLFAPKKRDFIRYLIPFFYFWAGLLKVNKEWLSGASLYGHIWFFYGSPLLPWACRYVLLLNHRYLGPSI